MGGEPGDQSSYVLGIELIRYLWSSQFVSVNIICTDLLVCFIPHSLYLIQAGLTPLNLAEEKKYSAIVSLLKTGVLAQLGE